jgi:hypothetical protein
LNKAQTTLLQFPGGKTQNYLIPNGITAIAYGAFAESRALVSVTIPSNVTNISSYAFDYCANLAGLYFQGNAPSIGQSVFSRDPLATVYYLPGTTGWSNTFGGLPAVPWSPVMQKSYPTFGLSPNPFGFTITGTPNLPLVIEASTNLGSAWFPLQTLTLTNGQSYFSDPDSPNHPARFYRLRSP